ncbi:MAG: hypothetical protein JXC32_21280 [Anaerolineae bacterium]|nr:hypothetical protein [Anaerolineae bacterium]
MPPTRADFVPRPHLIERLNSRLHSSRHRLILVSAPPGFGKTSLLAAWAQQAESPVAWLSLDPADNDPSRFWSGLHRALTSRPSESSTAEVGPKPVEPEAAFAAVARDVEDVSCPWALVLDDYHVITEPRISDRLLFLLEQLPPQAHLVLATRADPPWPLGRLRARGDLLELRTKDLRFAPDEVRAFLRASTNSGLSDADIATLDSRTEGWIAGLQLAALSIRDRDPHTFIHNFGASHRFILDYLVEEVLDRQPAPVQQFLLETSILKALSAEICDAVRSESNGDGSEPASSQEMLERLERQNLFVTPLDDERRWYRYHHLFADLLRTRLNHAYPDRVSGLHLRASHWYEDAGLTAEAVDHALAAGSDDRLAHLVENRALLMIYHGELHALSGWLGALPRGLVRAHPWLTVAEAWALAYSGDLDAAEDHLASIPDETGTASAEYRRLAGHAAAIRSYCALLRGDHLKATELGEAALRHLPEAELAVRGFAATMLGTVFAAGSDPETGFRLFNQALAAARSVGDDLLAIMVLSEMAALRHKQGRLHDAAARCREALAVSDAYARRVGGPPPASAFALARLAGILFEWNDLSGALNQIEQAVRQFAAWGQEDGLLIATVTRARVRAALGDLPGALADVEKVKPVARRLTWYRPLVDAVEAWLTLVSRMAAIASRREVATWFWDSAAGKGATLGVDDCTACVFWARTGLILSRTGTTGSPTAYAEAILGTMQRFRPLLASAGTGSYTIKALIFEATALQILGNREGARDAMLRALSLAEPEGYVRSFVGEGAVVAELLQEINRWLGGVTSGDVPSRAYVRSLLDAYGAAVLSSKSLAVDPGPSPAPLAPRPGTAPLLEPLSDRELDVLRMLPTDLTTPEIGDHLYITKSTVRTHIRHIYDKLGVHSRDDAVARARALGLL